QCELIRFLSNCYFFIPSKNTPKVIQFQALFQTLLVDSLSNFKKWGKSQGIFYQTPNYQLLALWLSLLEERTWYLIKI
ncbi:MAG TPA: hypothetical protein VIQ31_31085, partial [Phormidium sp.]